MKIEDAIDMNRNLNELDALTRKLGKLAEDERHQGVRAIADAIPPFPDFELPEGEISPAQKGRQAPLISSRDDYLTTTLTLVMRKRYLTGGADGEDGDDEVAA